MIKQYGRDPEVKSFSQAMAFLGGKKRKKIAHNTYVEVRSGDEIALRYHETDVVRYKANGAVILNNGGWKTVTTKERLGAFSSVSIYQRKYEWFVGKVIDGVFQNLDIPFHNGMIIEADGEIKEAVS
jgi:hypothetical protein